MEEIDLKELIGIFWKKKFLIILVVVIFAILGAIYSNISKSPIYESSTSLILVPEEVDDEKAYADYYHITSNNEKIEVEKTYNENSRLSSELNLNTKILTSSSVIATSQKVANKVLKNLNMNITAKELISSIVVTPVADSNSLTIAVTNSDAEMASKIANEVAKVFIDEVKEIYNAENFYILDEAEVSTVPTNSVSPLKNIVIFAFIGAVLVAGYILVVYMFDTSVKSSQDIENAVKLSTLTTIFSANKISKNSKENIKLVEDSKYPDAEMFRNLRTNIQFMSGDADKKVMLITSADSCEGKSYIAGNLANAFAKLDKKVLIIDADIRKGVQHTIFNVESKQGISDFLSDTAKSKNEDIRNYVQETNIKNLYLISKGENTQNPSDLLASPKMEETIEILKQSFDIIIVDAPSCLNVSDSLILSRLVDLTILVAAQEETKIEKLQAAKLAIENVGGKIAGVVLNKVPYTDKNICKFRQN